MREQHPLLTFTHRFQNGNVCTLTFKLDSLQKGKVEDVEFEWDNPPSADVLIEYMEWKRSVMMELSKQLGSTLLDIIPTAAGEFQVWSYSPNKEPERVR